MQVESSLEGFCDAVSKNNLSVYGVMLYREGKETAVHYFRNDSRVNLYSGSKTFTSVAVGRALDEGRFSLSDKLLDIFPEFRSVASRYSELIEVRHLLHMASGKEFSYTPELPSPDHTDYAETFFKSDPNVKPGELFSYSNAHTYMLSRIIERLSGETLRDYSVSRIFDKLEIYNPQWHTCINGHTLGATQLYLKIDEFLRLGIMLLQKGVYNDRQIVSESYVNSMISDTISTGHCTDLGPEYVHGYGYHVWRGSAPGSIRADGKYGQYFIVLPEDRKVIAVTAHKERNSNSIISEMLKL